MKEFNGRKFCEDLIALRGSESQAAFAEKLDINRSTLSLLETGKQIPTIHMLSRVCSISGIGADEYFTDATTDSLIYLMGSLSKADKQKIEEMAERIHIKEKYELLGKRGKNVID